MYMIKTVRILAFTIAHIRTPTFRLVKHMNKSLHNGLYNNNKVQNTIRINFLMDPL